MSTTEKGLAAVEVIGLAGAIIAGLLGERTASLIMIGLLLLTWQLWLTREVFSLRRRSSASSLTVEPRARAFLEEPLLISAIKKNRLKIDSDFLLWEQCTLMLWVLVPPKGQGLRNSPSNRYLLAHHTGEASQENETFFNQFCLRHSSTRGRWEVSVSNDKAVYSSSALTIADGLEPGWHHFFLAWNRPQPRVVFFIDGGRGGSDLSRSSFSSWPERTAGKVSVGAWMSEWEGHYCETELSQLLIVDSYLESSDSIVKDHLARKPRSS